MRSAPLSAPTFRKRITVLYRPAPARTAAKRVRDTEQRSKSDGHDVFYKSVHAVSIASLIRAVPCVRLTLLRDLSDTTRELRSVVIEVLQ